MNSKILFVLFFLVILLGSGCVSANEIDDSNVTTVNDESPIEIAENIDYLDEEDTFEEFDVLQVSSQDALQSSNEAIVVNNWDELQYYCAQTDKDYTLKLKENTNFYPTDPHNPNYQVKIKNNVKIIGSEGSYIGDSSPNARDIQFVAFLVEDNYVLGSLNFENITFKYIKSVASNALAGTGSIDGIFIQMGGYINNFIKNCKFYDVVSKNGHATIVYLKKGSATLDNCSFINCTSEYGVVSVYDPNSVKSTDMVVRNCYFENNYAETEPGCINNCGKLTVYNTTFIKNRSFWWAGAIHTHLGGNTTIYDSNFTDNVAGWNGGALYTYSYLQIYNSVFVGNNCTTNNGGGAIGACAYQSNPHIYIENCLFDNNANNCWALDGLSTYGTGRGGAISLMDEGSLEVINTTFISNSASIGTAICAIEAGSYGSPDIIIANNSFINHTRADDVLVVEVKGSLALLSGNYFEGNSIVFSNLTLTKLSEGKEQAILQVNASLTNPSYYDSDILEKTLYDVYINNNYVKTVNSSTFTVDFDDFDICEVYVIPTISNRKSNNITIISTREYIFVSKTTGNDNNNGISRETPVNTINRALELAGNCQNIILLDGDYSENNIQIDNDVTIKGEGNATLTNNTSFIASSNFTLKNLKINNISSNTFINQVKNNLVISNCIFTNNDVILVNNGGFASISNSILLNNSQIITGDFNNINLDCNWWGNSRPNLNITKFVTLNITSDVDFLENNHKSNVKVNFYLNDGKLYSNLPSIDLKIISINGVSSESTIKSNSKLVYTLTAFEDGILTVNYNNFTTSKSFEFLKSNPTMSLTTNDVMVGGDVVVKVNLPSDCEGNLTVNVGNSSKTNGINSTVFTFSDLKAGNYIININYSGDKKYSSKNLIANVNVDKYDSTTLLNISEVNVGEDLILTITTTDSSAGNVTLTINNITQTLTLNNSKASYTIKNIKRGDYLITAHFNGDDKYLASTDSRFIEVDNLNATILINTQDIIYGDVEIIEIALNDDATGEVTATIDGVTNTSKLINGKAKLIFYNLDAGLKSVPVFYSGDDTYFNLTESCNFTINKSDLTFNISSKDIKIGQVADITIRVAPGTTGTFTIGNDILTIPLSGLVTYGIGDLEIGNYTYTVTYNGNNYNTVSNTTGFRVLEYPIPQVPNEGTNTQNTHKSDYETSVNGEIAFTIPFNETLTGDLVIDSSGNVYLTTQSGIYAFNQTNELWYFTSTAASGNLSGIAISRDVIIAPKSGDTLYFINQTTGERYGGSNIYQGSSLFAPIVDANANLYIVSEYQYSSQDYKLTVIPYKLWENGGDPTLISIGNSEPLCSPTLDENIIVIISNNRLRLINAKTLETVSIKSGNFQPVRPVIGEGSIVYAILSNSIVAYNSNGVQVWKTKVTGGVGNTLAIDPEQVVYHVNAKKLLYKYDIIDGLESKVSDLKVTSGLLIGSDGTLYFGSDNKFYALDSEGNILWKSDVGCEITGNPVMDKDGLIYITTENGITALTHADLKDPEITITVSDIFVGDDATVTISVNGQCLGDLIITFDNDTFTGPITSQGIVTKTFSNLKAGLHTVDVEFRGDMRFEAKNVSANFTVNKYVPDLTVTCNNISVGEDAVFTINIIGDATGEIKLEINNKTYVLNASAITVPNLESGTYDYILTYAGDERYEQRTLTGNINVSKVSLPSADEVMNITVPEEGDSSSYSISLPSDATGNLTVIVDGEEYSQTLVNGSATVSVPELSNGTHNITIAYSGDEKYSPITKTSVVNVTKKDSQSNQTEHIPVFKLTASNLKMLYSSGQYFKVRLTKDNMPVQGEAVKFIIGDNVYTRYTDSNGYASLKIALAPNTYKVKVKYADLKTTNKIIVKSIINAKNVIAKKSAKTVKIKVGLKKVNNKYLKYKWVTLKFNKYKIKAKTNAKGIATFTVKNKVFQKLKISKKYTYQVIYGKDTVKKVIKFKK